MSTPINPNSGKLQFNRTKPQYPEGPRTIGNDHKTPNPTHLPKDVIQNFQAKNKS